MTKRRPDRRGEVGLTDCLFVIVAMLVGIVAAGYAGARFGWLGFIFGGLIGAIVSVGCVWLLVLIWAIAEGLLFDGIPYLPTCRNGTCKSGLLTDFGDYQWEDTPRHSAYFRCKCGIVYWRKREQGRVLEVLPDGTTRPYNTWCRAGAGRPETG
jgi:hypothetical protein